jgi:glycerol uptake facilitator protein
MVLAILLAASLALGKGSPVAEALPGPGARFLVLGALVAACVALIAVSPLGRLSGAHINPAVTVSLALRRGFPWAKVGPYIVAQFLGAFVAALLIRWNFYEWFNQVDPGKTFATQGVYSTSPGPGMSILGGLRSEIIGTAVLVMLVLAITDARNTAPGANMAPWIIGIAVVAIGMSLGALSGYAINPARDFGPRLASWFTGWSTAMKAPNGDFYFWVPIIGPLIGGAIGAYVYDFLVGNFLPVEEPEVGRTPEVPETGRPVETRPPEARP